MRLIEARWLQASLSIIPTEQLSPVLEIGSSSLEYRTVHKPYIEQLVHAPLRERGVRIVTADLRAEQGVQIIGDIYAPEVQAQMAKVRARTLLLCNLLEHLTEPRRFAKVCTNLVVPGGRIIVTVPHDYPYHLDPIDTMFRPGVAEIQALFEETYLESGDILVDQGYWSELRSSRGRTGSIVHIARELVRAATLAGGRHRAYSRLARLRYLARNYKISVAVLAVRRV